MTPLLIRLARYVVSLENATLDEPVWEKAVSCLLDAVGLGITASIDRTARAASSLAARPGGDRAESCRLWCDGSIAPLAEAVMANAVAVHAQFQDDCDTSSRIHPGALVVPSAVAAAEASGASVERALRAVIAAYSVVRWLGGGGTVGRAVVEHGFRASPTFGPLAASVAAASGLGLTVEETANAMSIACSVAGGLLEPLRSGSTDWRLQAGTAAWEGLRAAQFARAGVSASADVFESPLGFLRSFTGQSWEDETVFVGPAPVPDLILGVWSKPYPTLGDNVAVVLAAESIWQRHPGRAADIRAIRVHQNADFTSYPGTAFRGPYRRTTQAIASTVFAVAMMLSTGRIRYADYEGLLDDEGLLTLIERTSVVPESGYSFSDGRVEVEFHDGEVAVGSSGDMPRTRIFRDAEASLQVFGDRVTGRDRYEGRVRAARGLFDRPAGAQSDMAETIDELVT